MHVAWRESVTRFFHRGRAVWTVRRNSIVSALTMFGFVSIMLLAVPHAAHAEITDRIAQGFFNIVAIAMSYIVAFEGWLIAILVDVLIVFASYNGFATALPVQQGWVLIRDLMNMFFIVVLLVSAFATIIGYDTVSFHYSRVLPKLLLMAILINFSKTIIQLLIDFSQVLMLTFVNAFKSAAAGNFIQMFGLGQMLSLRQNSTTGDTALIQYAQLIPSYILAIVLLSIVISVLIIMIGFFIVRIVGLWVLLMFSPAAFFIQAVPERLKKSLSGAAGDYWSKLGTLLAGGPIMAFFIWLSLAITQSGGETSIAQTLNVYNTTASGAAAAGAGTAGTVSGFITGIGTSPQIASFVIAVALMLIGLQTAMKTAADVSKTLGGVAGKIKPFFAFTASAALGKYAAKGGYAAARTAYRPVDRRFDLTGKLSRTALKVPVLGTAFREPLAKGVTLRRKEREAEATKIADLTKGMTAEEKALYAKRTTGIAASPAEKLAKAKILSDLASDDARFKATKEASKGHESRIEKDWRDSGKITGRETPTELAQKKREINREALAAAKTEVDTKAVKQLEEAKKLLTNIDNSKEQIAEIDKAIEKYPALSAGPKEMENSIAKIITDDAKVKNLSPEAISNGAVLMGLLGSDVIRRDPATNQLRGIDQAKLDQFKERFKDQKQLITNVDALVEHMRESPNVDLGELSNTIVQNDSRGRVKLYEGGSGERRLSGEEARVSTALHAAASAPRLAPGQLGAAETNVVRSAFRLGLPISDFRKDMNGTDQALDNYMKDEVNLGSVAAANAPNDATFAVAFKPIGHILDQAKDLESKAQIEVLAKLHGDGTETVRRAVMEGDANMKKQGHEAVRLVFNRALEINQRGGPANAAETALIEVASQFKKHFPTSPQDHQNNNAGLPPGARPFGGAAYRRTPSAIEKTIRDVSV